MPLSPSSPLGAFLTAAAALAAVLALDGRRRLHRVACNGREVLLLTGGGTDVVVGWLPPEAETRS